MVRKAIEIPVEILCQEYGLDIRYLPKSCNIKIYVDEQNFEQITALLSEYSHKARLAFYHILRCQYNDDLYGKEAIDSKTKNITAIKFKRGLNYRIYCKEFYEDDNIYNKKIVLIEAFKKKSQNVNKELKALIKKISRYEYNL